MAEDQSEENTPVEPPTPPKGRWFGDANKSRRNIDANQRHDNSNRRFFDAKAIGVASFFCLFLIIFDLWRKKDVEETSTIPYYEKNLSSEVLGFSSPDSSKNIPVDSLKLKVFKSWTNSDTSYTYTDRLIELYTPFEFEETAKLQPALIYDYQKEAFILKIDKRLFKIEPDQSKQKLKEKD